MEAIDLRAGAANLLENCAQWRPGQRVLLVCERPELGWYDAAAPAAAAAYARSMGAEVSQIAVGGPNDAPAGVPADALEDALAAAIDAHDVILYFARIGDQDRFGPAPAGKTVVMSYAREAADLGGLYGRLDHRALQALKTAVDGLLAGARRIEITCPLGTDCTASARAPATAAPPPDVSVRRFPLGVPAPVDAAAFSGRVALARFLTPTGSRAYEPACAPLRDVIYAELRGGRIQRFVGPSSVVRAAETHYARVADMFGLDKDVAHSWHAGIHPGARYRRDPAENPDHWSNTAFTHPRVLHFHTCGAYAPGEICWMVLDATVTVDGAPLWRAGRLRAEAQPALRAVLEDWPDLRAAFNAPPGPAGV